MYLVKDSLVIILFEDLSKVELAKYGYTTEYKPDVYL